MDNNDTSFGFTFDARTVAPSVGFENLPEGWQHLAVADAKWSDDRTGMRIILKSINGVPGTASINLTFQGDPKAVAASQGHLSALCHVTGVYNVSDPKQFANIPFQGLIKHAKGKTGDTVYANVNAYKDMHGNEPGKTGAATTPQPQAPAQTSFAQPAAPANGQYPVSNAVPFQPAPAAQPAQTAPAQGGWGGAAPTAPAPAQAAPGFNQAPAGTAPPWGAR